jgi:predicted Ser/Thr protein kinase
MNRPARSLDGAASAEVPLPPQRMRRYLWKESPMTGNYTAEARGDTAAPSYLELVRRLVDATSADAAGWSVVDHESPHRPWIHVQPAVTELPRQGWKLHVSATAFSAPRVLEAAVPVLVAHRATFKLARSQAVVALLNGGQMGESQVGKFITVYPSDETSAVRLAVALDQATAGLPGPAVPSDRPLRQGRSTVYYRFGSYATRLAQTPWGIIYPCIELPDGSVAPDVRGSFYITHTAIPDPFVAAGVPAPAVPESLIKAGRYLVTSVLHRTPRGSVYLATDLDGAQQVVLKRARRDATSYDEDADARDRLRHEYRVMQLLTATPGIPRVYDLFEHGDDVYLVMEDVAGTNLTGRMLDLTALTPAAHARQVIEWGVELARLLAAVHERGLVYRDLKSTNVLVDQHDRLHLIDFEHACEIGVRGQVSGTRGYRSPRHLAGEPAAASDDVYALGALLYGLATGCEPSMAPDEGALLRRPIRLLNPGLPVALVGVLERCLDPNAAGRFVSMAEVAEALHRAADDDPPPAPAYGAWEPPAPDLVSAVRDCVRRIGDTLCDEARAVDDGLVWTSRHPLTWDMVCRDINTGCAGTVLALAEIASVTRHPRHLAVLEAGARALARSAPFIGGPLPGLYVGEAGVGAALLRAGHILGAQGLIEAAAQKSLEIAALPHGSPDLYNGTAGRLRFHLFIWQETGEPEHLAAARAAADALLRQAQRSPAAESWWLIPEGYGGLSGRAHLGYAHGAAGIADALLDLYVLTGDEQARETACGAIRWLSRLAVPVLSDGSGLAWPAEEGDPPGPPWWCHGAPGIARLLARAAALGVHPEASGLADRAARTTARGARGGNPVQCHGLAGNIEALLDVYAATGDQRHLAEAWSLAEILMTFAVERDGNLVFCSEQATVFTPDYLIGYGGIGACLARLADPGRAHVLSLAGFRARRTACATVASASAPGMRHASP